MALSPSSSPQFLPIDPRLYCETINELHSYITSSKRGYLTQAELFRYYRQRHDNAEIPYRLLGYRSLLDLLSSDQRLFAIDLRREPAYVYSAVKLRQEKRERRQGNASFSRQHHSTNTLDDQQSTTSDYIFLDHHVPLHEQQQQQQQQYQENVQLAVLEHDLPENVHLSSGHSLPVETPMQSITNRWHTPPIDEHSLLMDQKNNDDEESYEETTNEHSSNSSLTVPPSSRPSMFNDSSPLTQRKSHFTGDQKQKPVDESNPMNRTSSSLNRSISTSTTSLNKSYPFQFVDLYLFLCTVVVSFVFLGVILYKIC